MAAYRRVDDLTITCRLTACTPGSAPGPTLGIEYGKPLPLPFYCDHRYVTSFHPMDMSGRYIHLAWSSSIDSHSSINDNHIDNNIKDNVYDAVIMEKPFRDFTRFV